MKNKHFNKDIYSFYIIIVLLLLALYQYVLLPEYKKTKRINKECRESFQKLDISLDNLKYGGHYYRGLHSCDTTNSYALIGESKNKISSNYSFIGGGKLNNISGTYGFNGGGEIQDIDSVNNITCDSIINNNNNDDDDDFIYRYGTSHIIFPIR